jgi:hypothetical protein
VPSDFLSAGWSFWVTRRWCWWAELCFLMFNFVFLCVFGFNVFHICVYKASKNTFLCLLDCGAQSKQHPKPPTHLYSNFTRPSAPLFPPVSPKAVATLLARACILRVPGVVDLCAVWLVERQASFLD